MSEKNFLDVMTVEEVKRRVNAAHPGAWHSIMILDGSPIELDEGSELYVTETFSVRWGIKYYEAPHMIFKQIVEMAWKPEHVSKARMVYEGLKHKEVVSKRALADLERKEKIIASGSTIAKPAEKKEYEDKRIRDPECTYLVSCGNGEQTLTCYATFKNHIKSVKGGFEYSEDGAKVRYFIRRTDDTFFEVKPEEDKKIEKALGKARMTARTIKGKKGDGKPTFVIAPRVQNILNIW